MKGQLGTTVGTVVLDWVSVRLVMSVGSIDIDPTTHIGLFLIVARQSLDLSTRATLSVADGCEYKAVQ